MPNTDQKKIGEIVIDQEKGLIFSSEEELYEHFMPEIKELEREFFKLRSISQDVSKKDFIKFEANLNDVLEDPDEIWEDDNSLEGRRLAIYIRSFTQKEESPLFHVAVTYLTNNTPSFVYLHFPTTDLELIEKYRRGHLVYNETIKNAPHGAIEGDALMEGDELACGLYEAMGKLRTDGDIKQEDFHKYAHLREPTIEEADEIWRSNDSMGNILVRFIKEFTVDGEDIFYVAVTVQDTSSNSHALLFSFPTRDRGLVARYKYGEHLQAEEIIRESSH